MAASMAWRTARPSGLSRTVAGDIDQGTGDYVTEGLETASLHATSGWAKRFFDRRKRWAVRSRLAPVVEVVRMISRKADNVISS